MISATTSGPLARLGRQGAFSIIELLSVVAVMSLLLSLTVMGLGSSQSAGRMNDAVTKISLLLDQARTYAMARNTYVWIGFKEVDGGGILVSAVAGTSGMSTDISSSATYRPITKVQLFDSIRYRPTQGGLPGMEAASSITDSQIGQFQQQKDGKAVVFSNLIQFSPTGSVKLSANLTARWIELGLQPSAGNQNSGNVAALQVSSSSGQVRIFRP